MKRVTTLLAAFLLTASFAIAARADQTSTTSNDSRIIAAPTETADADFSSGSEASLPIGIQAYSFVYGPMVGDPSSGAVPTTWMDSVSGVSVQNQIGLRYDINDNLSLVPMFDFEVLVGDPNRVYGNQYVALSYDSFVKLTANSIGSFDLGEHSGWLGADLRYYVPSSEYSRDNNSLGSVRFTITPNVQLAHSNFSFALVNFARYYFQRQTTETYNHFVTLPRLMLYTGPLASYALNDKITFWSLLEASVTYDTKWQANTRDPNRSLVDFEPGFDWRVNDNLIISPYLNWFLRQGIDTTTVNLTASLNI